MKEGIRSSVVELIRAKIISALFFTVSFTPRKTRNETMRYFAIF